MSTSTSVSICSNALLMLGAEPISSFTEGTDRARLCANLYPSNRDAVLRAHTWNCSVKRVTLAPLATAPTYGFAFQYLLPSDWVRTIKLGQYADYAADFRQEGRYLLSDSNVSQLRYVSRNIIEGTWDALLVDVMTQRMAWKLAYPVTKSTALRESLRGEYLLMLQQAKSIDSMEEPSDMIAEESPLISVRS